MDVDKIGRWNQSSWGIPIHVWMSILWHLILSMPREAGDEPHGSLAEERRGARRGGGQGRGVAQLAGEGAARGRRRAAGPPSSSARMAEARGGTAFPAG